jgi:hypothetical protein
MLIAFNSPRANYKIQANIAGKVETFILNKAEYTVIQGLNDISQIIGFTKVQTDRVVAYVGTWAAARNSPLGSGTVSYLDRAGNRRGVSVVNLINNDADALVEKLDTITVAPSGDDKLDTFGAQIVQLFEVYKKAKPKTPYAAEDTLFNIEVNYIIGRVHEMFGYASSTFVPNTFGNVSSVIINDSRILDALNALIIPDASIGVRSDQQKIAEANSPTKHL